MRLATEYADSRPWESFGRRAPLFFACLLEQKFCCETVALECVQECAPYCAPCFVWSFRRQPNLPLIVRCIFLTDAVYFLVGCCPFWEAKQPESFCRKCGGLFAFVSPTQARAVRLLPALCRSLVPHTCFLNANSAVNCFRNHHFQALGGGCLCFYVDGRELGCQGALVPGAGIAVRCQV